MFQLVRGASTWTELMCWLWEKNGFISGGNWLKRQPPGFELAGRGRHPSSGVTRPPSLCLSVSTLLPVPFHTNADRGHGTCPGRWDRVHTSWAEKHAFVFPLSFLDTCSSHEDTGLLEGVGRTKGLSCPSQGHAHRPVPSEPSAGGRWVSPSRVNKMARLSHKLVTNDRLEFKHEASEFRGVFWCPSGLLVPRALQHKGLHLPSDGNHC